MDDPLLERVRRALAPEFEVLGRVAAGGMGIVYRARDVALDRPVAVKVLRPELATATARERFLREARILARLQHPNILPIHRADERDGLPFYVMDFVEGATLADRLHAGPLPPVQAAEVTEGLLAALAAAHAAGVVHRDVKPHNLFLLEGRVLLGDFGIAYDAESESLGLTEDGLLLGTREYMAPEQLRGEPASERSDQYSAAAVAYQAATGREWKALDTPAKANWRAVPRGMAAPLRRALAVDPLERWPSVAELRRAVRRGRTRNRRAVLLAILLGAVAWQGRPLYDRLTAPQPRDHRTLAILPFTSEDGQDAALAGLVTQKTHVNLGWFNDLPVVPLSRASEWAAARPGDGDPRGALTGLDVDAVAVGTVVRRGDSLALEMALVDAGATRPLAPIVLSTSEGVPADLGERAAITIAGALGRSPAAGMADLASHSAKANASFQQGEARFDEDAWHAAAERYHDAVVADPGFAMARWKLAIALLWSRQQSWEAVQALAACCAARLPPLQAGLVAAMSQTDLQARFAIFDSLDAQYGGDSDFLLLFGSDLFHRGPLVGRGLDVSLGIFDDAIATSNGITPAPAYDHMVWGLTRLGSRSEARRWLTLRGRLKAPPEGEADIRAFLQIGYDFRWVEWRARLTLWALDTFGDEDDLKHLADYFRFSATFDVPNGQDAMGRLVAKRLANRHYRSSGVLAQGLARLTWGQVGAGLALIDSAAALDPTPEAELQRHQWRLLLPMLGAGRAAPEEEARARRWLTQQAAGETASARARWTLALDALRRDDTAAARGLLDGLDALAASDGTAGPLALLGRAMIVGGADPRGALALTAPLSGHDSPAPGQDIFARSVLHLSRARWAEAAGDRDAALGEILWYENSDIYRFPEHEAQKAEVDAVASVAARVTRGRLLLEANEPARACPMLDRARELWARADSSLAEARAALDSVHAAGCR